MTEWTLTSSALILIVLLLRLLIKGRIGLRLQYALWIPVLLRLLLPFQVSESSVSVLNGVEKLKQQPAVELAVNLTELQIPVQSYDDAYEQVADRYEQAGVDVSALEGSQAEALDYEAYHTQRKISLSDLARWVWLGGMVLVGLWMTATNLVFGRKLKRSRKPLECVDAELPVYRSGFVPTPCLFGLFRPIVYVTAEVREEQLSHVLSHELTHYRHLDHIWAFLRCVCLVLHWYNPLVWWAARLSRRDAELACDEGAIRRLGEAQRTAYGRTLISMTCGSGDPLLTATTMSESKKSLKERIALIARHPKTAVITLIAILCIGITAIGFTFTGAKQTDETAVLTADRAEIRLFGSEVVQDDLNDAQINLLTELYENKVAAPTSKPVGAAARLEVTFYKGDEVAAVWTVTPEVCSATDVGNFIWENNQFDTVWELFWQTAPVDGGFIVNLLMSSLPPQLTAEEAQTILDRFRSMELTGTSNEPDWANSLCVELRSGETTALCFEIDQKGEVWLYANQTDRLNRTTRYYYMCKDGEAFYRELAAVHQPEVSLPSEYTLEQMAAEEIELQCLIYQALGHKVTDYRVNALTLLTTPDQAAEAWLLDYHLQMEDPAAALDDPNMELQETEDGWLKPQSHQIVLLCWRTAQELIPLGTTSRWNIWRDYEENYDLCAQTALIDYQFLAAMAAPEVYHEASKQLTLPVMIPGETSWKFEVGLTTNAKTNITVAASGETVSINLATADAAWFTPIQIKEDGTEQRGSAIGLLVEY